MSSEDRALAAHSEAAIREQATALGMDFGTGQWSYQQLLCQALPDHLLLLYRGENGPGDLSLFSAAIPRSANDRIRVIAIERRGYSLYSPAPVNGFAMAAFNHMRAHEAQSKTADWLATARCYAALTDPQPPAPAAKTASRHQLELNFAPTLTVDEHGQATVRFVDTESSAPYTEWSLSFDTAGGLRNVERSPLPAYKIQPLPQ
jgi:hypothetical protein